MNSRIDNGILRTSNDAAIATYFRTTVANIDPSEICSHLLAAIEADALPPRIIRPFLTARADNASLLRALKCSTSILVRTSAILNLGRRLRTARFLETWTAMGGTRRLVNLMSEFSVNHVRLLCATLARSSTTCLKRDERQRCMAALFEALTGHSESTLHNPDKRQLGRYYRQLLPACTSDLVRANGIDANASVLYQTLLTKAHPEACLESFVQKFEHDESFEQTRFEGIEPLLLQNGPADGPSLSPLPRGIRFNIELIDALSRNNNDIKPPSLLHKLVSVLVRRLARTHLPASTRIQAFESVIFAYSSHHECRQVLSFEYKGILAYLVRWWSRKPADYENLLVDYLRLLPPQSSNLITRFAKLMSYVGLSNRWPLLKLFFKHAKGLNIDIEQDEQLKSIKQPWPSSDIFILLPQDIARDLFHRITKLRGSTGACQRYLRQSVSIFDWNEGRESILEIYLEKGLQGSLDSAKELILQHQKEAAEEADPYMRAVIAEKPICCAIASGSYEFLRETLIWARRFNKDHQTVPGLYSRSKLISDESIELLSGIPRLAEPAVVDSGSVRSSVQKGNEIMLLLLETACMGVREPSFQAGDWDNVFDLFGSVTLRRVERSCRLQNDDLWECVWEDTLKMLSKAEEIGLREDNVDLTFNKPTGPLDFSKTQYRNLDEPGLSAATLRFFDEFAAAREHLWKEHRKSQHAEVVTLPSPWPHGLPIQSLLGLEISIKGFRHHMPYIVSRAKAVVFANPATALRELPNHETRLAIGEHVDDYPTALRLYINAFTEQDDVEFAIQEAWEHAVNKLNSQRLDRSEKIRFWRDIFIKAYIKPPVSPAECLYDSPTIPQTQDSSELVEWNPDPAHRFRSRGRRDIKLTCFDCMLWFRDRGGRVFKLDNPSDLDSCKSRIPVVKSPIFDHDCFRFTSPRAREALIIATLLSISDKHAGDSTLLSKPFPSENDARFPALYLDDEFLDGNDKSIFFVKGLLTKLQDRLPTFLVLDLVGNIKKRIEGDNSVNNLNRSRQILFMLAGILIKGENPRAVLELAKMVVVKCPQYSTYHRQLINSSLLKRLPSSTVKDFLSNLAQELRAILKQMKERKSQENSESEDNSEDGSESEASTSESKVKTGSGPFVKVTTVKMLAQLFSDPIFIDEATATDLLVDLFTTSGHVDISNAIVESLGTILTSTKDEALREKIITALEQHVVPIAASLHERRYLSDEDWVRAEHDMKVPDVLISGNLNQSLDTLMDVVSNAPQPLSGELMDRLLLPTMRASAKYNTRWTRIFCQANNLSLPEDLPQVPARPFMLRSIVEHCDDVPTEIFKLWAEGSILELVPTPDLREAIDFVLGTPEVKSSNAGEHFLNLWHIEYGFHSIWNHSKCLYMCLYKSGGSTLPNRVSYEEVRDTFIRHCKRIIAQHDHSAEPQALLLEALKPPFVEESRDYHADYRSLEEGGYGIMLPKSKLVFSELEKWALWRTRVRPLIQTIVEHIDQHRTRQWQQDPQRKPTVLLDTYDLRLWMLDYPLPYTRHDRTAKIQVFAEQIKREAEALGHRQKRPYHNHFRLLKEYALKASKTDFYALACDLGSKPDDDADDERAFASVATHLRVEIADSLLSAADKPRNEFEACLARDLVNSWCASTDEDIRMRGHAKRKKFEAETRRKDFQEAAVEDFSSDFHSQTLQEVGYLPHQD